MEIPGLRSMVGYVWYLFKKLVFGTFFSIIGQLLKFGFVLLLTYLMGLGIFHMWENNIPIAITPQQTPRLPSISRSPTSKPSRSGSYPFVVEIPAKKNGSGRDSMRKPSPTENVESPPTGSFNARTELIKREAETRDSVMRESLKKKLESDAEENENAEAVEDEVAVKPPPLPRD